MRKIILLFIALAFHFQSNCQKAKGSWQDYLSYTHATKIALAGDKIYCATEGGLLYYDMQDKSINKFSGLNGLSEFGINTIAYSSKADVLIIAYKNSNIDLVHGNSIINLPDIKRKQVTGDKTIYNISVVDHEAYLSCGFGIVVINLLKREVKDTYYPGDKGSPLKINDVESDGNKLYAATDQGILSADKNGSNLLDYRSWQKMDDIPRGGSKFNHLVMHSGNLIANYTPDEYNMDELYLMNNGEWFRYHPSIPYVYDMQSNSTYLAVTTHSHVYVINEQHEVIALINNYQLENNIPIKPRSAAISGDGTLWIADYENSFVKISGENHESIYPNGPLDNEMFALYANEEDLWIASGGRSDSWNNTWQDPRFQLYRNQEWSYFNSSGIPELDGFHDVVAIIADPVDPDHIFVGSWGGGLLEFREGVFVNRYTHKNSALQTALPEQPNEPFVRIGGLGFDSEGNLWMTNSEVPKNLLKFTTEGQWESFSLPEIANNKSIGDVIVTQNDDKWIVAPRGRDMYVVDKSGENKKRLLVTAYFNNGTDEEFTRMNDIYSIAEDNEGAIWIGTSMGVAVYNTPFRIWDTENFYASRPSLDLNDGYFYPLLQTETVTAIAVDGANRKWLGTENSGVYLVSENGEKEILHFTAENSPLLSNTINSIAINQKTGEVFFGTDQGLISYQGNATEGSHVYENVYVYPNPVRENYDGPVTVTGLIEDTDVKITDISGNLVYKTKSLGGEAIWDGRNLNGNRVKTGVYLVFCNDKTGEKTHITKLLFIH